MELDFAQRLRCVFHDRALSGLGDVRVDLRRVRALVAEQLLHDAQVGATIEQVRGERVSQQVRVRLDRQTRDRGVLADGRLHGAYGQAPTEPVEQQRVVVDSGRSDAPGFGPGY